MSKFCWRPVGGLGEVGMNCMLMDFGGLRVLVDAGILFADDNSFGIEALYPDFEKLLREEKPAAILITHGHEDHIGAVEAILSTCLTKGLSVPPIYAPPFAAGLLRERVGDDVRFPMAAKGLNALEQVDLGEEIELGDNAELRVRWVPVRHSIVDACSLAFTWKAPEQNLHVFHTSDFKLDANAYPDGRIQVAKAQDVFGVPSADILFVDSTNAPRPGHSPSEREVALNLERLLARQTGRVFVTLFSSNVQRVGELMAIAARQGRHVALLGRSLQTAWRVAAQQGVSARLTPRASEAYVLEAAQLSSHPPHKQMVICTGSQGEFRSALSRLAIAEHPDLQLGVGDCVVFSSALIPGNEMPVSRLINALMRQGAQVLVGEEASLLAGGPIHATGHARAEEITELMRAMRPKNVVPVHGELRQLRSCALLARDAGKEWGLRQEDIHVVEDLTELSFACGARGWGLEERTHLPYEGRILRFPYFTTHSKDPLLKARKRAAEGGVVLATIDSLGRVRASLQGVWPEGMMQSEQLKESVEDWLYRSHRKSKHLNEAELSEELSRHVKRITGIKPLACVHVMEA